MGGERMELNVFTASTALSRCRGATNPDNFNCECWLIDLKPWNGNNVWCPRSQDFLSAARDLLRLDSELDFQVHNF